MSKAYRRLRRDCNAEETDVSVEEMANSKDPQDILDELEAKLKVSDDILERMDRGEFRNWMDIVTDGIACLAHESLEAKARADRETDKSRVELDLLDEVRHAQERYIEEWHKGWQTAEIQALVATSDRPMSKTNFKLIDKVLMSFGWFLVSAGPAKIRDTQG